MKLIPILMAALLVMLVSIDSPARADADNAVVIINAAQGGEGAWLGVTLKSTTVKMKKDGKETEESKGAVIEDVVDDSPADSARLKEGDVVTKLNDKDIAGADDLVAGIADLKPGDKATLTIQRDGEQKTVGVVLGSREDESYAMLRRMHIDVPKMKKDYGEAWKNSGRAWKKFGRSMGAFARAFMPYKPVLGIQAQTLNKQLGEYFKAPNGKGVLVTDVMDTKNSPANQAGIKAGDVIVKINDESVEDIHDIRGALSGLKKGTKLHIGVVRNGQRKTLMATLNHDVSKAPDMGTFDWSGHPPMGELDGDNGPCIMRFHGPGGKDMEFDMQQLQKNMPNLKLQFQKFRDVMERNRGNMEQLQKELKANKNQMQRQLRESIQHSIDQKDV